MKKLKKILFLSMTLVVCLPAFVFGACDPDRDIWVVDEQWNYYRLRRGRDGVALVHLNDESLIVDGVLTIPTTLGRYNVVALRGRDPGNPWAAMSTPFCAGSANKIIIPEGIAVRGLFWSDRTPLVIEFLAEVPDERSYFTRGLSSWGDFTGKRTMVVPDGSRAAYIARIHGEIIDWTLRIIEKSEYLQEINKET